MNKKKLSTTMLLVFSIVLFVVSGAIFVHSAQSQVTHSTVSVSYVADNVSFTSKAFYQVAGNNSITYFTDTESPYGQELTFVASDSTSYTRTLNATDFSLGVNNNYVLLTFSFRNDASSGGYCIKVSLTDGTTNKNNVNVTYLSDSSNYLSNMSSPTSAELTSQKSSVSSASAPTDVYIEAGDTKYFYILVEVDNLYLNANYTSTASNGLVWNIQSTTELEEPPQPFIISGSTITGLTSYGQSATTLTVPSGITTIGDHAFEGQDVVTEVILPSTLTTIGGYAFFECSSLQSINIPSSLTNIGYYAFIGCNEQLYTTGGNYSKYLASGNNDYYVLVDGSNSSIMSGCKIIAGGGYESYSGESLYIPDGVEYICDNGIFDSMYVTSISLPNSLIRMYGAPICGIYHLASITVRNADNNTPYYSSGNCLIERSTNKLICGTLNSTIPSGVVTIDSWAFESLGLYGVDEPWSIVIPDSVTTIEDNAFNECYGFSLTIGAGVTYIGSLYYAYCDTVSVDSNNPVYASSGNCLIHKASKTIIRGFLNSTIPTNSNLVTSIGDGAFGGYMYGEELFSLTIPANITSIGDECFSNSTFELTFLSTTPPTLGEYALATAAAGSDVFVIYVPSSAVNTYKNAEGWSEYADYIQAAP